jgi:hypothetical protein
VQAPGSVPDASGRWRYHFRHVTTEYILSVVSYDCVTWSLTLREEHSLRVFKNRVLRKIFQIKREEGAGDWRRLYIEELYKLYASPNVIRVIKSRGMLRAGYMARMGEIRNACNILVGKSERKRPVGRRRRRWKNNIRLDLREIVWKVVN